MLTLGQLKQYLSEIQEEWKLNDNTPIIMASDTYGSDMCLMDEEPFMYGKFEGIEGDALTLYPQEDGYVKDISIGE